MRKKNHKKSNINVGKKIENDNQRDDEVKLLIDKGESFGDGIISMMSMFACDYNGIGVAAIGLAKALAALKGVAAHAEIDIKRLYESQLAYFDITFKGIPD